jgi:hypothetical protein
VPIRPELRHLYKTEEYKLARARCKERAGDRCEQCGRKNGSTKRKRWVGPGLRTMVPSVLIQCGAAHLNNIAGDDRPENLAWLCRGCHLHHDQPFHRLTRATRKDAARPLLAAAAEWGKMFEGLAAGGSCAPRAKE